MVRGMPLKDSTGSAGLISAMMDAGKNNPKLQAMQKQLAAGVESAVQQKITEMTNAGIKPTPAQIQAIKSAAKAAAMDKAVTALTSQSGMYVNNDYYYPMGQDVQESWGQDEDVPVTYASYIFKKPQQWEFHAYGMTANGPIGKICRAYGFAGAYYVTPMWHVQGEYVKNVRKLPLNNERPYSFNYGLHYGTADVLKGGSYEFGLDYVYSQAGTYFGGSSDDIVDQYMGHIYKNWHGMKNVPAYIANVMEDKANGTYSSNKNYGGAKFFLAKASFVPMRGLIIDAEYGFNAKDMGGRKMDNLFMLKATAYLK